MYFSLHVPCRWPAMLPFHIDLFSPEINTSGPWPRIDEIESLPLDATVFELYAPGTALRLPKEPAPGAPGSLLQRTFLPERTQPERWVRLHTLSAPVTCGSYLLRAETRGDDQNGWRLRLGADDDTDPGNAPPPNSDNPDGRPGTGDEAIVGLTQTTYQHNDQGAVHCLTLHQFVRPGLPIASFHNFDLDDNERVRYYPPGAAFDPAGAATPGSFPGTVSSNRVWNGGTQTERGSGDPIADPEPGWWRIVTCVRSDNQFNQEGQTGVPIYREPVPEPDLVVTKDDGRTLVAPGEVLTYTIAFENRSLTTRPVPGAAFDVTLRDTLPANTSLRGCRLITPGLAGGCRLDGNSVLFTLDEPVVAGASGQVEVSVGVNPDASGSVANRVALDYADTLGNPYPTAYAEDIDQIPTAPLPALVAEKTARITGDRNQDGKAGPGDLIAYTIMVRNAGPGEALAVQIEDTPDPNTHLVPGSVQITPPGAVLSGNEPGATGVTALIGRLAAGAEAVLTFTVQVNAVVPPDVARIANQGTIRGTNFPPKRTDDPSTPPPDDPTDVPYAPPGGGPPTAIELLDLHAEPAEGGTLVRWRTGSELGSAGFLVYRSPTATFAEATQITPALILAQGGPQEGAAYQWLDRTAPAGPAYYWLVEVELDGGRHVFGPVAWSAAPQSGFSIFLPMLVR